MISKGIKDNIYDKVYDKINKLINRFIKDGVSLYDLYNFYKKNIKKLILDIQQEGKNNFDNDNEYFNFIKIINNDVFNDRISEYETEKLSEKNIIKYADFINEKLNKK